MSRLATCACGQLRVTCSGAPDLVSLCHCRACQRRTGSAFGIAAFFPRGAVAVEGEARCYERPSDSGHPVRFHFCPACGSTVYWEPQRKPDHIAVGTGSFADPSFPAPTQAVYSGQRQHWISEQALGLPTPSMERKD